MLDSLTLTNGDESAMILGEPKNHRRFIAAANT
jgi:hypothetical protein